MIGSSIPLHPTLEYLASGCDPFLLETPTMVFSCAIGIDPKAVGGWEEQITFGRDSDWSAELHGLRLRCKFPGLPQQTLNLFGDTGLACSDAELALVLEWTSEDSGQRGMSNPYRLALPLELGPVEFSLEFPPATIRGSVSLSLQLLLWKGGHPSPEERHLANTPGFRLGRIGRETRLSIDGDGSLFPIIEVPLGPDGPLWEFRGDWVDPLDEEFSPETVCLAINTEHQGFTEFRGSGRKYDTLCFKQVLASWLTIFLLKVAKDDPQFFLERRRMGTVSWIASYIFGAGELTLDPPEELAISAQKWIHRRITSVGGES